MLKKCAVLLTVLVVAGTAFGFEVPLPMVFPDLIDLSMNDASSFYDPDTGYTVGYNPTTGSHTQLHLLDWDPNTTGVQNIYNTDQAGVDAVLLGKELRGVFTIDSIELEMAGVGILGSPPLNNSIEITGVMHGLEITKVSLSGSGINRTLDIEYAPTSTQTKAVIGDDAVLHNVDGGGRITLYADDNVDGYYQIGPDNWGAEQAANRNRRDFSGTWDPGSGPIAGDFTDGSLVADLMFANLTDVGVAQAIYDLAGIMLDADVVMMAHLNFNGNSVQGGVDYAFLNFIEDVLDAQISTVSGGGTVVDSYMSLKDPALLDVGGDALMSSALYGGTSNLHNKGFYDWQMSSKDPIHFTTVPEPATMALVGLGLLGIVRRRRKKA